MNLICLLCCLVSLPQPFTMPFTSPFKDLGIPTNVDVWSLVFDRKDVPFPTSKKVMTCAENTKLSHTWDQIKTASIDFGKGLKDLYKWRKGEVLALYTPNNIDVSPLPTLVAFFEKTRRKRGKSVLTPWRNSQDPHRHPRRHLGRRRRLARQPALHRRRAHLPAQRLRCQSHRHASALPQDGL